MLLDRGAERLDEEHVAFAAVGLELCLQAVVGEASQPHRAQWLAQVCADLGGQLRMGAAAEHRYVPHADQGSWPALRPDGRPVRPGSARPVPARPARASDPDRPAPAPAPRPGRPRPRPAGPPAAAATANTVPATFPVPEVSS